MNKLKLAFNISEQNKETISINEVVKFDSEYYVVIMHCYIGSNHFVWFKGGWKRIETAKKWAKKIRNYNRSLGFISEAIQTTN